MDAAVLVLSQKLANFSVVHHEEKKTNYPFLKIQNDEVPDDEDKENSPSLKIQKEEENSCKFQNDRKKFDEIPREEENVLTEKVQDDEVPQDDKTPTFLTIPKDCLEEIFKHVSLSSWHSVLSTSQKFSTIGKHFFKTKFVTEILSTTWKGTASWAVIKGKPIENPETNNWANITQELKFSRDGKIVGTGNQPEKGGSFKIWGEFDLGNSEVIFRKEFLSSKIAGRVNKYSGVISFTSDPEHGCSVSVKGKTLLEKLGVDDEDINNLNDEGIFTLSNSPFCSPFKDYVD